MMDYLHTRATGKWKPDGQTKQNHHTQKKGPRRYRRGPFAY
jgi:hypothetical protein